MVVVSTLASSMSMPGAPSVLTSIWPDWIPALNKGREESGQIVGGCESREAMTRGS